MNTKSKFSVTLPPFGFILGLCLNIAIAAIVLMQTILSENSIHIAMYILFALLMLVFSYLMLMTKLFKVDINGSKIKVRTSIGLKYCFDVTEIINIKWNIRESDNLHTEKILIQTSSGKKVSIESIMIGFDNMAAFLSANVDNSKINTFTKK